MRDCQQKIVNDGEEFPKYGQIIYSKELTKREGFDREAGSPEYVVINGRWDGGGSNFDGPFPNGWLVTAVRRCKPEERVEFYASGCFSDKIDQEKIIFLGWEDLSQPKYQNVVTEEKIKQAIRDGCQEFVGEPKELADKARERVSKLLTNWGLEHEVTDQTAGSLLIEFNLVDLIKLFCKDSK